MFSRRSESPLVRASCVSRARFLQLASVIFGLGFFTAPTYAALQNRTIDDQFGDQITQRLPVYTPSSEWAQGSTCTGCSITQSIDATQPFDKTWHDATYNANNSSPISFTLEFNGTAIYVFFILANQVPFTTTLTNVSFVLDSDIVGSFVHVPDSTDEFQYNSLVYSNESLPDAQHTLQVNAEGTVAASLVLFDRAIYTFDTDLIATTQGPTTTGSDSSSPTSASPSPTGSKPHTDVGAIAGGVAGGVVCLAVLALLAFFLLRRRSTKNRKNLDVIEVGDARAREIQPFMVDSALTESHSRNVNETGMGIGSGGYLPSNGTRGYPVSTGPPMSTTETSDEHESEWHPGLLLAGATAGVAGTAAAGAASSNSTLPTAATVGAGAAQRHRRRNRVPPPGSKAALRQQELDAQVRDIQNEVNLLQARQSQRHPRYAVSTAGSGSGSTGGGMSTNPPSSNGDVDADGSLQAQIYALRREVERLQAERDAQEIWIQSDEPPPEYDEEEEEEEGQTGGGTSEAHTEGTTR